MNTDRPPNTTEVFLDTWKEHLPEAYPTPAERALLFQSIKHKDTVGILSPHGSILQGKAVLYNPDLPCWVLNVGGGHGIPAIASAENTIFAPGAAKTLKYAKKRDRRKKPTDQEATHPPKADNAPQ